MIKQTFLSLLAILCFGAPLVAQSSIAEKTEGMEKMEGYFDMYYDADEDKVWLEIDRFDQEFLYVSGLPAGVGSNDIGLDRNQLGDTKVVKFIQSGPKVLLVQPNYDFRAISDNQDEVKSVEEAFAKSIIWGFKATADEEGTVLIDLTDFLLRDAHGVASRMKRGNQGNYKVDKSRSTIYLPRTKNFPMNTEMEARITFTGDASGRWVRSVTPSADAVTVRMHHSFVELPDDNYETRTFDPRSGYYAISYQDYATPIDQSLVKRFIRRHRLEKKNPNARLSEAVEPIVYYLDRGAPEPIRSALIEGASWWNQAFEAAGYKDAFQVKVLPEGVDPMDLRYNVINWVHRSTRGWSYGSSVVDPRTGEIIKGHVALGSLRVRQDFLIAQGLVEAYENGEEADPRLLEMALARLRQLSAHEVGHTLGLVHNFAASTNDRSSVMDYPHPYLQLDENGDLDFSEAYDVGIGDWDKRTILYGYQDFPANADEEEELKEILSENQEMGFRYMADSDSRPIFGAHPYGHLWDNGATPMEEMKRLSEVRATALANFGEKNIPVGTPMHELERVLVPLYLAHRYQIEAISKVIGGVEYTYAARGDGNATPNKMVVADMQREALDALLSTLEPEFLALPESLIEKIPPPPVGYGRGREHFNIHTGLTFDPIGAAESSANTSITFLLNPQRLTRIIEQHARDQGHMDIFELFEGLANAVGAQPGQTPMEKEIGRMTEKLAVQHILNLAGDDGIMQQVSAAAMYQAKMLGERYNTTQSDPAQAAHYLYLGNMIRNFFEDPSGFETPDIPAMPDGSPIGCGGHF
ncbi:MAG TPA: zinc-dependent metalloprotease [Saprospiraceae bacterium]|nr:zinc-dependent metalloprotease [Saprospiraceae bacterium]